MRLADDRGAVAGRGAPRRPTARRRAAQRRSSTRRACSVWPVRSSTATACTRPIAGGHARTGIRRGEESATGGGRSSAVTSERVEALLIGGDEQDLATHQASPSGDRRPALVSIWRRSSSSARRWRRRSRGPSHTGRPRSSRRRCTSCVAEVDDVDRATVVAEQGDVSRYWNRRWTVDDEDLLRHREPGIGRDQPARAVDRRRRDPWEPLVQPGRVADELPHVVGRSPDAGLVTDRAEHPTALPNSVGALDIVSDIVKPCPPSRCTTNTN